MFNVVVKCCKSLNYSGNGESNREWVCNEPECSFSGASGFITSMWQTGELCKHQDGLGGEIPCCLEGQKRTIMLIFKLHIDDHC